MTETPQQLDDYVAAMHLLVQDGRAVQAGRRAFADASQALDALVSEQHEISATMKGQHDQLRDAISVLQAQDVESLAVALREHYSEYQQRLIATEAAFHAAEATIGLKQGRIEEGLDAVSDRLKDVAALTRQQGEIVGQRQATTDTAVHALTLTMSSEFQAVAVRIAALESATSDRIAELEKRLSTVMTMLSVVLVAVLIAVVVAFVR